jgi:hypothetical protein
LACVLATIAVAWYAAMLSWGLSLWIFVVPQAIGFLVATWLRAPNWIADLNSWRRWRGPVAAVAVPMLAVAALVPIVRLAQINRAYLVQSIGEIEPLQAELDDGNTPAARETAEMYVKFADQIDAEYEDRAEFTSGQRIQALLHHLPEFLEITKRPSCRFTFDYSSFSLHDDLPYTINPRWQFHKELGQTYQLMDRLMSDILASGRESPFVLDTYLALLRFSSHLREGQPTTVLNRQLFAEQDILREIGRRATSGMPTKDGLLEAIAKLNAYFASQPIPALAIIADRQLVRNVILEKDLPLILADPNRSRFVDLAYMANKLPWERRRALQALDLMTAQQIRWLNGLVECLTTGKSNEWPHSADQFRENLASNLANETPTGYSILGRPADTSFLAALEFTARVSPWSLYEQLAAAQVDRNGTILQLALVAYRRNHDAYPESLDQLVPDYLEQVPIDPYSGTPFLYRPKGVDRIVSGVYVPPHYDARIEPSTPFFWSVGRFNLNKLIQTTDTSTIRDSDDPNAPPIESKADVYQLTNEEQHWRYYQPVHVFVLPK